jgi:DNA-3-methyladenine glycosylase
MTKLLEDFYTRDVLEVAPELLGKSIVRCECGERKEYMITETEAYRGTEDLASHASKGRTRRNPVMFDSGGKMYVYLIYGMHWMLNIVTSLQGNPQAVLIRGITDYDGPGKLARELGIDKTFYGEDLCSSKRIWLEDNGITADYYSTPRIGIDYAGDIWKNKPWRFVMKPKDLSDA